MGPEGGARVSAEDQILTVNLFLVYHTEAAWGLNHDVNDDSESDENAVCEEGAIIQGDFLTGPPLNLLSVGQ